VHASTLPGAHIAYWAVLGGVFVTAFYSFRLFFLVFHGKPRDQELHDHAHETPKVVTVPLILLAIPSVFIGGLTVAAVVFGGFFENVIAVLPEHAVIEELSGEFHGAIAFGLHALQTPVFWTAMAGVAIAALFYLVAPAIPAFLDAKLGFLRRILENKYGFDDFNQAVFARGSLGLGQQLWQRGDVAFIDGLLVNGSARGVGGLAAIGRHLQSGLLYHYAFAMIIGLLVIMSWLLFV